MTQALLPETLNSKSLTYHELSKPIKTEPFRSNFLILFNKPIDAI